MTHNHGPLNTAKCVKRVKCPVCKCGIIFSGHVSTDGTRIEIPRHGPTLDMDCKGAGWHELKTEGE